MTNIEATTQPTTVTHDEYNERHTQDALKKLIKLNNDSAGAYRTAVDLLDSEEKKTVCRDFMQQHNQFSEELARLQSKYGGTVPENESMAGLVQGIWMNIRHWSGNDTKAILTECDRADELAIDYYKNALEYVLPDDVKQTVQQHLNKLQQEHGRIHKLARA